MARWLDTVVATLAATCALLLHAPAHAQPSGFDVPRECGTEREFRDGLVRLLGASAERAWPATLVIAREPNGNEYRLTLEVQSERRELVHADCRVLFRSALVIAAVTVDPTVSLPEEPAPSPPAPDAAPPPPPAVAEPTPPPAKKSDGERAPLRASVALGGGLALGVLPSATGIVEVRGGLASGRFGATLGAQYFTPRDASTAGRSARLQGLGLRGAASFAPTPLLAASLGMSVDWLVGRGSAELSSPVQDSAWALAPFLELALTPRLTRSVSLELAVTGQANLQRATFEVIGFGEIYQMPPASLLLVARGVFHFF
ncbi:MAG TPA: hypothetical protein VFV94_11550 [Polyangiaceae bacterium]|nr:hypothetical protein [Polyangiaceae bacterium]